MLKRLLLAAAVLAATTVSARAQVPVCSAFGQSCVSPDTTCSATVESPTTTICSATVASSTSTTPSSLLTGLTHYWTLNEASGTRADSVGGATLADNNTVLFASGVNGNAAAFVSNNAEKLDTASFTVPATGSISLWMQMNKATTDYVMNFNAITAPCMGIIAHYPSANQTAFFTNSSATNSAVFTAYTLNDGAWHHIVVTWSGGVNRIIIDNTTPVSTSGNTSPAGTAIFALGNRTNASIGHNGAIDEVGVWSRVLTSDEITTLYNSGTGKFYPSF